MEIKDAELELQALKKAIDRINGVNSILENEEGEIAILRQNYVEKKLMLPGGGVERGELPKHACTEETDEETGLLVEETDLIFQGQLIQRVPVHGYGNIPGFVNLYWTKKFTGNLIKLPIQEVSEIEFMDINQILQRRNEFSLAYLRMIIHHLRIISGLVKSPIEVRLSDSVDWI